MNFAENKFLIITAAVAVVLSGGLVYYGMTISTEIEETHQQERQDVMRDIKQFGRGTPANPQTIEQRRARVEAMKAERQQVIEDTITFNRRPDAYVIPELTLRAEGGKTKPALPFVEQVWVNNGLYFDFVQAYFAQLDKEVAALQPAALPTEQEIQAEATKVQKVLNRLHFRERRETGGAAPSRRSGDGISDEAYQKAYERMRLLKAQQGNVYADINSFDLLTFVRRQMVTTLPPEQIWQAHLSMWVSSDIVDAINQTVEEVYQSENVSPAHRGVPRSPVKRLVSIRLERTAAATPRETRRRDVEPDDYSYGPPASSYGPAPSYSPRRGGDAPTATGAETLTQRTTTEEYNVIHYEFTVIMPHRYVPVLQQKLLGLNYHTILEQDISLVTANSQADEMYYYGTEPVREVTFSCELLLLSDWVRGTFREGDDGQGQWVYPPLMPISVMEGLTADQQRPTDEDLIEGQLPRPWDPSWRPREESRGRRR
jgi:hypothetical protein